MGYMALDFPATPTDGQEYDNFIYSATKGAWVSKPNLPVKTAIGPVAPSNPNAGDQWLDSNTGTLYVYYTDVDSSQWVEILAKSSVSSALYGRVGVNETDIDDLKNTKWQSYNYIINGAFDIWQRGPGPFSGLAAGYRADMWRASSGTSQTIERLTDVPNNNFKYSIQSSVSGTAFNTIAQRFEQENCYVWSNTLTLSFWAKNVLGSTGLRIQILVPNSINDYSSVTSGGVFTVVEDGSFGSAWNRYSVTFNIPGSAKERGFAIEIQRTAGIEPSSHIVTGVQLEEGPTATPFHRNAPSIQAELSACQRYYWQTNYGGFVTAANAPVGIASASANTLARVVVNFPVSMRQPPISANLGFSSVTGFTIFGTNNQTTTSIAFNGSTTNSAFVTFGSAATLVAGQAYLVRHISADDYLSFSVEL